MSPYALPPTRFCQKNRFHSDRLLAPAVYVPLIMPEALIASQPGKPHMCGTMSGFLRETSHVEDVQKRVGNEIRALRERRRVTGKMCSPSGQDQPNKHGDDRARRGECHPPDFGDNSGCAACGGGRVDEAKELNLESSL